MRLIFPLTAANKSTSLNLLIIWTFSTLSGLLKLNPRKAAPMLFWVLARPRTKRVNTLARFPFKTLFHKQKQCIKTGILGVCFIYETQEHELMPTIKVSINYTLFISAFSIKCWASSSALLKFFGLLHTSTSFCERNNTNSSSHQPL